MAKFVSERQRDQAVSICAFARRLSFGAEIQSEYDELIALIADLADILATSHRRVLTQLLEKKNWMK